jgi:hypothetical protein
MINLSCHYCVEDGRECADCIADRNNYLLEIYIEFLKSGGRKPCVLCLGGIDANRVLCEACEKGVAA